MYGTYSILKSEVLYIMKSFLTLRQICPQFKFICLTDTAIFLDLGVTKQKSDPIMVALSVNFLPIHSEAQTLENQFSFPTHLSWPHHNYWVMTLSHS